MRRVNVVIVAVQKQKVLYECASVASGIQHAKRMRRIILALWPAWLYHIFPHYLIHGRIFGKMVIEHKICLEFLYSFLFKAFLILRRIQRDAVINVYRSSCKVPNILVRF